MKKIFIFCFFMFLILPCFANEEKVLPDKKDENKTEEKSSEKETENEPKIIDYKYFPAKRKVHKNRLNRSHKMEHYKTMSEYQSGHNKNKMDFKRRRETELELLKMEAEVLDYHP